MGTKTNYMDRKDYNTLFKLFIQETKFTEKLRYPLCFNPDHLVINFLFIFAFRFILLCTDFFISFFNPL